MKQACLTLKINYVHHRIVAVLFLCAAVITSQSLYAAKFVSKSRNTDKTTIEEVQVAPKDEAVIDNLNETAEVLESTSGSAEAPVFRAKDKSADPLEFPNSILNQRKVPPAPETSATTISTESSTPGTSSNVEPESFEDLEQQLKQTNKDKPITVSRLTGKLTLSEAELLALDIDPLVKRAQNQQEAFKQQAVAAYSWPDPKIRMGVVNLSADSYDFDQEPMTQAVIGVAQPFPPAGATSASRNKFNELASAQGFDAEDQQFKTLMGVRKSWFNVYLQHHSRLLVQKSLKEFDQLIKITRYQYRAGSGKQQDVVRAQLEQSLLEDREKDIQEMSEAALAELHKWVGDAARQQELDMQFPVLPELPDKRQLESNLEEHPAVRVSKSRVKASENEVEFANAQFRPGWMLDLSYGYRGANRDNLISAMFVVDLPLFTGNRQGRQLSASKAGLAAAKNMLDDTRRTYKQKYNDGIALFTRTNERLEFYRTQLLPQAQQNTKATMNAYQSGVTGFNDVVRARLTELTSQLQYLKLQVDQAKAQADLLYLAGG